MDGDTHNQPQLNFGGCPSSAEYPLPGDTEAKLGHAKAPSPRPTSDECPNMRTAVLTKGVKVKGTRVRCKAKLCPVCGPIEWRLHMEPVRMAAEAGETLYFVEIAAGDREAFHKRVKRSGGEAKYVPTHRDVFLCVTTYACGVQTTFDELEVLMMEAFTLSAVVAGNVTGTRGWKKAAELQDPDGSVVVRRTKRTGWSFRGYAGMSPAKAAAAAERVSKSTPKSWFIPEVHGWTASCASEASVDRVLLALRVLDPHEVVGRKLQRQSSNVAIGHLVHSR